jgi:Na+-transporting methylmalonyl-CoA/oxaloacetate decarboxylase gamma subunit
VVAVVGVGVVLLLLLLLLLFAYLRLLGRLWVQVPWGHVCQAPA